MDLTINIKAKSDYTKEYELVQYTPHIHFQADEKGACLRASEVKPKLDRFILSYLERKGIRDKIPAGWILKSDEKTNECALNYKVSIQARGHATIKDSFNRTTYFGNMGDGNNKKSVFYNGGLKLIISTAALEQFPELGYTSGSNTLMGLVDRCLPTFFELNCFGTRSTKGWGSYGINVDYENEEAHEKRLLEFVDNYYKISIKKDGKFDALDIIRVISSMMKGGINYKGYYKGRIYCYFLDNIKSDKSYMKSHIFEKENNGKTYRYVRAMLGLTESVEFKDKERKGKVTIKALDGKITRFNNPVHFIPNGKTIIMLPTDINPKLDNSTFRFSMEPNSGEIKTPSLVQDNPDPSKGEFDLECFLDWFIKQIENRVDEFGSRANAPKEVIEIMDNIVFEKVGGKNGK